jgi:hypothetical protein
VFPRQHPCRRGGQRSRSDGERGAAYQQTCAILPGVRRGSARQPSPRATRWVQSGACAVRCVSYSGTDAVSRSMTYTNAMPALGRNQPSNPSVMLGVGSDTGSRDSRAWVLPAM